MMNQSDVSANRPSAKVGHSLPDTLWNHSRPGTHKGPSTPNHTPCHYISSNLRSLPRMAAAPFSWGGVVSQRVVARGGWDEVRGPCGCQATARYPVARLLSLILFLLLILTSCSSGNQPAKQPDPRLKSFHIVSARIIMLDTQAEVDGIVQNLGHDAFPFDVTIVATLYDSSGHVIGQAQGTAEDVFPGTDRSFALMGQVDSARYSHMKLSPVSLREVRYENTPTPVVP